MKEYRVMAYFTEDAPLGYRPRSFRRKIVNSYEKAVTLRNEALMYYSEYKYIKEVIIESREVTDWKEE